MSLYHESNPVLSISLVRELPPPFFFPFFFLGTERSRDNDSALCRTVKTQPCPNALSARSILDSTVSCDFTERKTVYLINFLKTDFWSKGICRLA